MEEPTPVSFTTADGKEVSFKAKRGRPKGSKKVVETPVTPQEPESSEIPPTEISASGESQVTEPQKRKGDPSLRLACILKDAADLEWAAEREALEVVSQPSEPVPAEPVRMKPKAKARKPAAGLPEKLSKKTR